jgi:hypothetical protein
MADGNLDTATPPQAHNDLEVEYFALSHGISLEQAQDLVAQHSFDPVELVRAATRLSQSGD